MMWNGQPYFKVVGHRFDQVGTLIKFKPGTGKFIKAAGTPIPLDAKPDRPMDLSGFWVEGQEWIYPGVGRTQWGMDCSCWNSRITLDYFARSFAAEYDRFSVAVLDTNGNLITRIGRYGNVDDGVPLAGATGGSSTSASSTPGRDTGGQGPTGALAWRPASATRRQSIGGDEVALFDACYLATFTDRRLFIADAGQGRILSVKLNYDTTDRVPLKDVKDSG